MPFRRSSTTCKVLGIYVGLILHRTFSEYACELPIHYTPSYEIKNNLKIHSQRAPVSDWVEWRDRLAMGQIRKYAKFVDYWMERFDKLNDDRIFLSYETLTDDNDGPEEAIRITNFLARSEGVDPIGIESVPCIWRAVVKYKGHMLPTNPEKQQGRRLLLDDGGRGGRRRLDPEHHDSQRSGPTERPYTPELLEAMSHMLIDCIQRLVFILTRISSSISDSSPSSLLSSSFMPTPFKGGATIICACAKSWRVISGTSTPHIWP